MRPGSNQADVVIGTLQAKSPTDGGWRIGADEAAAGQLVSIQDGRAPDGLGARAVAFDTYNQAASKSGVSFTLDTLGNQAVAAFSASPAVRRLTPTECERLQGFPDGWTIPDGPTLRDAPAWYELAPADRDPEPADPPPDGPRYAAMGDAVTVPVIEWIGRRLAA